MPSELTETPPRAQTYTGYATIFSRPPHTPYWLVSVSCCLGLADFTHSKYKMGIFLRALWRLFDNVLWRSGEAVLISSCTSLFLIPSLILSSRQQTSSLFAPFRLCVRLLLCDLRVLCGKISFSSLRALRDLRGQNPDLCLCFLYEEANVSLGRWRPWLIFFASFAPWRLGVRLLLCALCGKTSLPLLALTTGKCESRPAAAVAYFSSASFAFLAPLRETLPLLHQFSLDIHGILCYKPCHNGKPV